MVERENSQASATLPQPVNSNANVQNTTCKPLFVTEADIKTEPYDPIVIKEELVCNPDLTKDVEKNATFLQENAFAVNESNYDGPFYHDVTMSNLEGSWQPLSEMFSSVSDPYFEANSPLSFWGSCPLDLETMKMDDVFQVDKDDLIQSPTLAELNANDESLFDSFDNFDVFFPSDSKAASVSSSACDTNSVFKLSSLSNTDPVKLGSETLSVEKSQESQLPGSFIKSSTSIEEPDIKSESSRTDGKLQTVPTLSVDSIKSKLRQKACLSPKEAKRTVYQDKDSSSLYSVDEKIETISHFAVSSNPDNFDSDEEDSEMDCNYSSDADEESEEETKHHPIKNVAVKNMILEKKKSRYFWQYNIQAKGPKAPKIKLTEKSSSLHDFADPIFSSDCPVDGVKHAGKARRGDGNDLTPNPKKLYNIGVELEKLNSVIDGLTPVNELPLNARSDSRKEKNKLASRACRLKKKAQHEANKLKLFGLQQEQKYLLKIISEVKILLRERIENFKPGTGQSVVSAIDALSMKKAVKVAGCSADFVNNVLKNVASGDESGGLRGLNAAVIDEN